MSRNIDSGDLVMQTSRWSESILAAHEGFGSRLCENVRFQEVPGIIFCVMPPRPMLGAAQLNISIDKLQIANKLAIHF
jgi:hypothetical protein